MSKPSSGTFQSVVNLLEAELATFSDRLVPLLSYQIQAIQTVYDLLNEDGESIQNRSKQRRSEVSRARELLIDTYLRIGPEVFLLCTIALSISALAKLKPQQILPELDQWWKSAEHPEGLKSAAEKFCNENHVDSIVSSYRARRYPGLRLPSGKWLLIHANWHS